MYEWAELIKLWEREQVTPEQVIGQWLRHGEAQQALLTTLQRRLEQVERLVIPPQPRRVSLCRCGGKLYRSSTFTKSRTPPIVFLCQM